MRWRGYHLRERGNKQDAGASKLRQQQLRSTWTKIFVSLKRQKRGRKTPGTDPRSPEKRKNGNAVDPEAVSDSLN